VVTKDPSATRTGIIATSSLPLFCRLYPSALPSDLPSAPGTRGRGIWLAPARRRAMAGHVRWASHSLADERADE
jgi:hypothetical protein